MKFFKHSPDLKSNYDWSKEGNKNVVSHSNLEEDIPLSIVPADGLRLLAARTSAGTMLTVLFQRYT